MNRFVTTLTLTALLATTPVFGSTAQSQTSETTLYDTVTAELKKNVVCIRGKPQYSAPTMNPATKDIISIVKLGRYHGTGFVYDTEMVNGKKEYLILTNNHVASNDAISVSGATVWTLDKNDLFIVENTYDNDEKNATKLEVIAVDPDHDAAILRTINAEMGKQQFQVYKGKFGLPKATLGPKDELITFGFPYGRSKVEVTGAVSAMEYVDVDVTAYPNTAYLANIPIDPGQSGSPVFYFTKEGTPHMIALVYAGMDGSDTIKLLTPESGFRELLQTKQNTESKKPKLQETATMKTIDIVNSDYQEPKTYDFLGRRLFVYRDSDTRMRIREHRLVNRNVIENESMVVELLVGTNGIEVESIMGDEESKVPKYICREDLSDEKKKQYDTLYNSIINHFSHKREQKRLQSIKNSDPKITLQNKYYTRITREEESSLYLEWYALHSYLYLQDIITDEFL